MSAVGVVLVFLAIVIGSMLAAVLAFKFHTPHYWILVWLLTIVAALFFIVTVMR